MRSTSASHQPATPADDSTTPSPALSPALQTKLDALGDMLRDFGRVITAFSGGVDSSLVAYMAHRTLADKALAVTSASESLSRDDLALAKRLAAEWGMNHRVIQTRELDNPAYRANPVDRCYHCKNTLYTDLVQLAEQARKTEDGTPDVIWANAMIVNGTNADDLGDHRPGLRAAQEAGVRAPLAELSINKAEIRQFAAHLGLPNHDKPQAACLSSRVPYGLSISREVLDQIEKAEAFLQKLGLGQLRVRHHDDLARIEVLPADFHLLLEHHEAIEQAFKALGYRYVTLDLQGFRSGSLNEGLTRQYLMGAAPPGVLRGETPRAPHSKG